MNIEFPKDMIRGVFSIPTSKEQKYLKAKLQKMYIKNQLVIQVSLFTKQQVFHENISLDQINDYLNTFLELHFRSLELVTTEYIYAYKVTSKGKILTNKRRNSQEFVSLEHNKKKKYLIEEGTIVPPLIDLGIMTSEGKIVKAKSDKFRQINRFLEMIEDSISKETHLKIIDFGCGKSYLTFILYFYLTTIKKIKCEMIGLDLKDDVIKHCIEVAEKYNYDTLKFRVGNISDFKKEDNVDMIVTLHACDTATDYALYHAVKMQCKYIFSVPCCQHEINLKLNSKLLSPISNYGLLKERFSAILTDSIRAYLLEAYGYKVQVLEFVEWDSTPKNVLIRASYTGVEQKNNLEIVEQWVKYLNIEQTLYTLLTDRKSVV